MSEGWASGWVDHDRAGFETFLRLYPALDDATCAAAIAAFDADVEGHAPGLVVGGLHPEVKSTTDLLLSERALLDPEWARLETAIREAMADTFVRYRLEVPGAVWLRGSLHDTGFLLQRYEADRGRYLEHVDADGPETSSRVAAAVLYLNDDYEGGETSFPAWRVRVRPRRGHVLWFPAGFQHVHRGEVPRGGAKHVVTTFACFPELRYRKERP